VTVRERLFALEAFGIKLGLENMRVLMAALVHPERACPTIHVAGTNGKGSVCAMVECALRASGHRTGLYTSPHLDRLEERVAVDGVPVQPDVLDAALERTFAAADAAHADGRLSVTPTFFEVTTAAAFDVFRTAGVEVGVIEVGLGGRFDATNVVAPAATAITSIAFDHERHLGSTLAAIAAEKAGIIKPAVPVVMGALPPEARAVVERAAREAGAPLLESDGCVTVHESVGGRARVAAHSTRWPDLPVMPLGLLGGHQVQNAATTLRLLEVVDARLVPITDAGARAGLTQARWPARLEWLRLPGAGELLIDAAHNPAGAEALASYLHESGTRAVPIVLAAMQDKDIDGMVRPLARVTSRFLATTVGTARALSAQALAARIAAVAPSARVDAVPEPDAAIAAALGERGRAVAAGSIYFVGPLRARLLRSGAVPI
jgi:dihydrofolate synthase / folylpolyglutamate synthase